MNAIVEYWYSDLSAQTGYQRGTVIPEENVSAVVMDIFSKGLNVMLYHGTKQNIIWVDNKRFTQR